MSRIESTMWFKFFAWVGAFLRPHAEKKVREEGMTPLYTLYTTQWSQHCEKPPIPSSFNSYPGAWHHSGSDVQREIGQC